MAKIIKQIAIYFDVKEILITRISLEGNLIKPEIKIAIPTNFQIKDNIIKPISVNSEFFNEKQEWINKFKEIIKKSNLSGSEVIVSFSNNFSINRFFTMPYVDRKFWNKSIPIESRKYIPVAFEEMVYDFYAYPILNNTKLAVLFGITQRKTVEFILGIFKNISLNLIAIETSSISFERFLTFVSPQDHNKKIYIHFSELYSYVLLSTNGSPVIYRETLIDSSSGVSERKSLDIKSSIAFVKRYISDQEYNSVVLSGENTALWQKIAESESGLKSEILDLSKVCVSDSFPFNLIVSIGANLLNIEKNSKALDISGISSSKKIEKNLQKYIFIIIFSLSSFFLFLSGINYIRIFNIESKLTFYKKQMTEAISLEGLPKESIIQEVDRVRKKSEMMKLLISGKEYIAPKLSVISDTIPRNLWIKEFNYFSPIAASEMISASTQIDIKGFTDLKGENKFNAVEFFVKQLKVAPEFSSFVPPRGNIDKTIENSTEKKFFNYQGSNNEAFSEFNVNCLQNKK